MSNTIGTAVRSLWWLVLVRGILLVLLGIFALVSPVLAVWAIVVAFGAYAVVDGVFVIIAAITSRKAYPNWGWVIAQGALTIIAGVLILALPGIVGAFGVLVLLWFLVFSSIVGGIMQIIAAARQRESRVWGIVAGVLDILFGALIGILVLVNPVSTSFALIWVIAIAAIVFGVILIVTSFQVRRGVVATADRIDEALAREV